MSIYQLQIPRSTDRLNDLPNEQRLDVIQTVLDGRDSRLFVDLLEDDQYLFFVNIESHFSESQVESLINYYEDQVAADFSDLLLDS